MANINERCHKAKILYEMYRDEVIHLYLLFLKPILHEIQTVNKVFQNNESDPTRLLKEIILLINFLKKKILDDEKIDVLYDDFEGKVLYTSSLGHEFEIQLEKLKNTNKIRKNKVQEIRNNCINFVVGLINQLKQR